MRKFQQRQILELLRTIEEAQAAGLYASCQEGAISIGEFIESIEGEGTKTVTLLEEYCELLYKASNPDSLHCTVHSVQSDKPDSSAGKPNFSKKLKKALIEIENSVKFDLKPNKIEIVFFPYKASMWDSLESIYLAAKDDPACDAYVVPIPYYDKLPDHSFGQMHYEGGRYPDYVPITDWKTYNVEERRPDAIFVHNPYDNDNYVTSVHQDFYSERLKQFTEMLCYVPYFVSGDRGVGKHFVTAAGCIYANKVIVESEKICDLYINVFKETFGNRFGLPKDKFIALGSPKFDKVINTKKEDCQLPEQWRKLIGDKKVVLYNTTIGAILQHNEKYLEKLRSVLAVFKERKDVVLWWRPHPLNEATYNAMRPQLLREYEQIIAEYKRGEWGIYDDTTDLHRAIAVSDAYYGDGGSLVILYQCTGKPLMRQRIDCINDMSLISSPDEIFCETNEDIWFMLYDGKWLWKINKITYEISLVGPFPSGKPCRRLYSDIIEENGKLYFTPCEASDIEIYNTMSKQFERTSVSKPVFTNKREINKKKCNLNEIIGDINKNMFFIKKNVQNLTDCLYVEFRFANLFDFISYICLNDNKKHLNALHNKQIELSKIAYNADGNCGIKTYRYIKNEVSK